MTQKYTDEEQNDIKRFESRFQAHVTESKEYRRAAYTRPGMDFSYYRPGTALYEMEHRVEPLVAIHMPGEQFARLMEEQTRADRWRDEAHYAKNFMKRQIEDERVRDKTPAVAKAYKNYLMLLELAR